MALVPGRIILELKYVDQMWNSMNFSAANSPHFPRLLIRYFPISARLTGVRWHGSLWLCIITKVESLRPSDYLKSALLPMGDSNI